MNSVSTDLRVLEFPNFKKTNGNNLWQILTDGLSTMETISQQMVAFLEGVCEQFPRLFFLSDREVIYLLSFHPTPSALEPFVQKCFKGIRWLDVESEESAKDVKRCGATSECDRHMKVLGFFANFQERITFLCPLEPNLNALVWLGVFEQQLKLTMKQLLKQCAAVRNKLESSNQDLACDKNAGEIMCHIAGNCINAQYLLDVLLEHPLQCLLVAEEALWCSLIQQAFQESSPLNLSSIKANNSAKLNKLAHSIRNGVSKYIMTCLHALVQLTMNHAQQLSLLMKAQGVLESSFEWLSMMKYYVVSDNQTQKSNDDPTCYVEVLGHSIQYGYEYFGPEDWVVHTPSTDRAILGIILALTSYRCGFVRGPCMSGKTKTVVHLGKALGRQVVTVQCCPNMTPDTVQKMLLGALHTGALLVLDSVDLLTQGVLSSLAQHLLDIHQSFLHLTRNKKTKQSDIPKDRTADDVMCCMNTNDPEFQIVFADKSISANLNYGCVLISSKTITSEVPESLRYATRSIALTHPDYRIITEVMLTSTGFSEAVSLSRRLVSLISLAKDSFCLPDFVNDAQCCYLVVLRKIISASEIYFNQSLREEEISDEVHEKVSATVEKGRNKTEKSVRLFRSHLLVIRAIMEETAIVKALISVLLPGPYEHKKALQFYVIFKDAFPIACQFPLFQQYIEEQEKNQLKEAVIEELQRRQCHADTEIICSTLTLYQTMKFSETVLLIGPSGCGKTTCYSVLAGALNILAAKAMEHVFENDNMIKENVPQEAAHISTSNWNFVDTAVIFPNAMSQEELFGCLCEKRGWIDGVLTRLLRDSEQCEHTLSKLCYNEKNCDQTPNAKWLILDGEPVGQPGWLDNLTTLCNPDDPFLILSSGEKLVPSQSHLKLLIETTDLSQASPSAVTRCGFVHFIGTDLWKAVWKSEIKAISFEHKLDQKTLKMWSCLAEDLFSSTLSSIREMALNSSIHTKDKIYGLQEIVSFARVLRALLHHFEDEEKDMAVTQVHNRGTL